MSSIIVARSHDPGMSWRTMLDTVACWVDVDMLRRAVDAISADLPGEAA